MTLTNTAKRLLQNKDSSATACFCAVNQLLSDSWKIWEPETIWLSLQDLDTDVPEENRNQIMAVRTFLNTDRYWYDSCIFADISTVLNNEELNYEAMEDVPVAHLAWAVKEAQGIIRGFDPQPIPSFDREVVKYVAIQLFREGFLVTPDELSWAQTELDKLYPDETSDLREKVQKTWATASQHEVKDAAYPENSYGVQLAKLASVRVYVDEQYASLKIELAQLQT